MVHENELTEERVVGCPTRLRRIRPQARKVHRLNLPRDPHNGVAAFRVVVDEERVINPLRTLIVSATRLVRLVRGRVSRPRTVICDEVPDPVGQVILVPDAVSWKGSTERLGGGGLCRVVVEDILNGAVGGAAGHKKR